MRSASLLLLLLAAPAPGLEPYLVRDINPEPGPGDSAPAGFAAFGGVAVFDAYDGVEDRVLWRSDGTAEGTWQLGDFCRPGCFDALERFATLGDRHLFLAQSGPLALRKDLWATDGTGTVRLTADVEIVGRPALTKNAVWFVADDGIHGRELWVTDGTPAGTRLAADVLPGPDGSDPWHLTAFRGQVWFAAGSALWRSDGTRTVLVKTVPGAPRLLRPVGKRLTFVAAGPSGGEELWASDRAAPITGIRASFLDAAVHGGRLYFTAETRRQGQELWASDGTPGGTRVLTRFARREAFYAPLESMFLPLPPSSPGGRFVFAAHDGVHGPEPWVTDGTPKGTRLLRDLCPGECRGVDTVWLAHRGLLYMTATNGARGYELWVTDGTEKGTRLLRDVCRGSCDAIPSSLLVLGDRVLFAAWEDRNGWELWATDGTAAGTVRLSGFAPDYPWQSLHGAVLPGRFLFGAGDGVHGIELWVTDGTPEGTELVRDLNDIDVGGSFPSGLRELGGEALFFADDGTRGYELWKSDGTEAGTVLVAELVPGEEPLEPPRVLASAAAGGNLYLSLEQAGFMSLWRTDGTAAGKVADIEAAEMVSLDGKVWFTTGDAELWVADGTGISPVPGAPVGLAHLTLHAGRLWFVVGGELWSSDGTAAGTPVLDLGFSVHSMASLGEDLILSGDGLWATDGTPEGTRKLAHEPWIGAGTVFQGRLYFEALSRSRSVLWVTDGTPQGTGPLRDADGQEILSPAAFAVLGDRLLFTTRMPGAPLWESNGTEAGTVRVRDLAPGWQGDWELLRAGSRVFFLASDGDTGLELWAVEDE